ncbi:MAG TPA: Lrp/AsnC ligand binding domain-containing protein [Candidatus Nanoarchaeia archaeon]
MKAYVLVSVTTGKVRSVQEGLSELKGGHEVEVLAADNTTGPFDVIVLLKGGDMNDVAKFVAESIPQVNGVERTLTCWVTPAGD